MTDHETAERLAGPHGHQSCRIAHEVMGNVLPCAWEKRVTDIEKALGEVRASGFSEGYTQAMSDVHSGPK